MALFVVCQLTCVIIFTTVSCWLFQHTNCACDRIVCRTGKLSAGNSSGDVVVTIDDVPAVWTTKFTYQVTVSVFVIRVNNSYVDFHCLLGHALMGKVWHFIWTTVILEVEVLLVLRHWYDVQSTSLSTICNKLSFRNFQFFSCPLPSESTTHCHLGPLTRPRKSIGSVVDGIIN